MYEKPTLTASNKCLKSETALNLEDRVAALDRFSQRLVNSTEGPGEWNKSFKRRVPRCQETMTPLHRSENQSAASRRTKKLLAKSNWFRSSKEEAEPEEWTSAQPQEEVAKKSGG